jgi:stearoyl-CoA desaturase (Delta-9 desaturase)
MGSSNIIEIVFLHVAAIVSVFFITKKIKWQTILLQFVIFFFAQISITGGYHRLWSHRSYEAHPILEFFYFIFGTIASQNSALKWARDHRTHHRNEEREGDPYNINKGLWHAHMGWLLQDYDEPTKRELQKTSTHDLKQKKLLVVQDRYYAIFWLILAILGPTLICMLWNDAKNGFLLNFIRIILNLQVTWCVNSFAHYSGSKPFDKKMKASDNLLVSILTMGEGWHNYHHSHPKDYRCSQVGKYNPTTWFIDFTHFLGLSKNHKTKTETIVYSNKFDLLNYSKNKF